MFEVLALRGVTEVLLARCPSLGRATDAAETYRAEGVAWVCYVVFAPTGEIIKVI